MVANCRNSAKSPSERETYVSHFEGSEGLKTVRPMFVSLSLFPLSRSYLMFPAFDLDFFSSSLFMPALLSPPHHLFTPPPPPRHTPLPAPTQPMPFPAMGYLGYRGRRHLGPYVLCTQSCACCCETTLKPRCLRRGYCRGSRSQEMCGK